MQYTKWVFGKGAFKYYISAKGEEGDLTSIAYVAYTFRGVGGVPEQNAYVTRLIYYYVTAN